jgi:hypothetical protein
MPTIRFCRYRVWRTCGVMASRMIVAPAHVKEISPQNAGAGRLDRARETSRDSSIFVLATVLLAWAALALAQDLVVRNFFAHCMTAELVHLFCSWLAAGSLFTGAPFVAYGAHFGPVGVLVDQASGSVVFGTQALITVFHDGITNRRQDGSSRRNRSGAPRRSG